MGTLIQNKLRGVLNVVCVKPPKFGEMRESWLEDIAVLTGGTFISSKLGMSLKNATVENLGSAKKIKVDKDSTTIIGGNGDKNDLQDRIKSLHAEIEKATSDFDKENFKERLAKLTSGIAIIRVGAATEIEMKDKKLRLEDALAATRAAIDEGIVPGGGIAYLRAFDSIDLNAVGKDNIDGYYAVKSALLEPFNNIVRNAGHDCEKLREQYNQNKGNNPNYGFDVMKNDFVDMIEGGIIDPAKVTRTALQNALSVATMIISTQVLIADEKEESETNQ